MTPQDAELVAAAMELARTRCHGDNHTVAAVVRARDGRTVPGVNVYHFTGGPCAELVALGAAVVAGVGELDTIVAAGDSERGVIPPCGRCRQILLDLHPEIRVIVPGDGGDGGHGSGGGPRSVPVRELLPAGFVWADQQRDPG